ncbi:choice-of-anchor D domain-containing protein, partial [Dolichospermum sp. ST_sed3]|nr:choice-of-anchor D domain-containing protein [Dolichospermum sp. ST_sed3]
MPTINRYIWSPDGKKMLIANAEGKILIWEPYGDNIFKKINGINETVYLMSWKPDGKYIAWISNSGVTIWDVEKGVQYKRYTGSYEDWNRYRYGIAIFYEFAWTPKGLRFVTGAYQNIVQAWFLDEPALQEDISDSLFQIVEPKVTSLDIDLKQCLVGSSKDSLISNYIINESDYSVRIDSAFIVGADSACFNIISGIPPVEIQAKNSHNLEFSFKPNRVGIHQAKIVIITQADTLIQNISGEGVEPVLSVISDFIDFGVVDVGSPKDSLQAVMIKNIGHFPLTITKTEHALPNAVDFTTLAGGGSFTINPGDTAKLNLRFKPSFVGRTNGSLLFEYNGIESPAIVQLFGEGVRKNPAIRATAEKFPTLVCDNKTSINVTLKNEGGKLLEIKQLKIKGTDANDFSTQDITPITIEPDSSKIIIINFTSVNVGQKTSDLEIISNAYPDSILTIPLNGRKELVSFIPGVTSIDLGTLCPNE